MKVVMDRLASAISGHEQQQFLLLPQRESSSPVQPINRRLFSQSTESVRLALYSTLFVVDMLCLVCATILASQLRLGEPLSEQSLRIFGILLPTYVAVAANNRAYSIDALRKPWSGAMKGVEALFYASTAALVMLFYMKSSEDYSRSIFAMATVSAAVALVSARVAVGKFIGRRRKLRFFNELVITDGVVVTPWRNETLVFADQLGFEPGSDDPHALHFLSELLERCDRVVVACPPGRRRAWSQMLKGTTVDVEIVMPELTHMGAISLSNYHGEHTMVVSRGPLRLSDRMLKRAFDLCIASLALILFAPVMLVAAAAIKLDSEGPVFFHQQRVGKNNRLFNLLKFRSMRSECADATGTRSASKADDRVTRVGRFLRASSIDELPQLLNVLAGNMSIVGPRPHALGSTAEDAHFWQIDARYFDRHSIKPGITGLAQVRGFRGATMQRLDLTNRLQSDLEYLTGWTIWRDLAIVVATFRVLVHRNAF